MSILAASVCLSTGETLVSRQFVEMSAPKVHEMLSSCSVLLNDSTNRSAHEEHGYRYICEPLDDLFVVLISDAETANIIQDLKTLHLLTQLVKQVAAPDASAVDSDDVVKATFSIIDAFDEVVTMGYSENLTETQVETFMKMESYEERIQQIIEHNKQLEAAEQRKRMAKQLESERIANQNKMASGLGPNGLVNGLGPNGLGSSSGGFGLDESSRTPASGFGAPVTPASVPVPVTTGAEPSQRKVTQKTGAGLKLGRFSTSSTAAGLPEVPAPQTSLPTPQKPKSEAVQPVPATPVSTTTDIAVSEQLTIDALRDGAIRQSRASGTLSLVAGDREHAKLRIKAETGGNPSDYKPHPKMDRALFASERVLGLKNSSEDLPVSQVLLVKWTADNVVVPLSVSCWVSDANEAGFKNVTVEYELNADFKGELESIAIKVPLPSSNAHVADPSTSFEQYDDSIVWSEAAASADSPTASFEFTAEASEEDDFYPIEVSFRTKEQTSDITTFGKIDVSEITDAVSGEVVEFNKTAVATTASYVIH